MVFPQTPLPTVVELFYDDVWNDITSYTRGLPEFIDITRGRSNEAGQVEASRCGLTINNRDGRFSPRNPLSPLYGLIGRNTPLRVKVDTDIRSSGEVPAWPQRWDGSGNDVWVPIEAAGVLRRLGQGKPVPTSGIRSTILANQKRRYWSLDDAVGTAKGIGFSDSISTPPRFKTYGKGVTENTLRKYGTGDLGEDLPAGLEIFDTAATDKGYVYGDTGVGSSATATATDFVWRAEDRGSFSLYVQEYEPPGSGLTNEYRVNMSTGNTVVVEQTHTDSDGDITLDIVLGTSAVLPELSDGARHHLRFALTENGADVDWAVFVDGISVLDGTMTTEHVGGLARIRFEYDLVGDNTPLALGHVAVWAVLGSFTIPSVTAMALAATQYDGETAGRRIERLCAENDISFTSSGDLDDTVALGPQSEDDLLAALRAAALADGGILYEPRTFLGLTYRTRVDLYNQTAALELDYTDGVFSSIPEPVDDDQLTRNDVTVTRESGGSAQRVLQFGALSVQDPPDGVGRYATDVRISLTSEGELANQASWRLSLGTVDEARFPSLALHLHHPSFVDDAALTTAAAGLDLGDRVCIDNMPDWVSHDLVEQMAQGFKERLSNFLWFIEVNASPYSPYQVAEYGEDGVGAAPDAPVRYSSAGTVTTASFDAGTDTALEVGTLIRPYWTTDTANMPFDILVAGVRLRVTAISAPVGDFQTMTVEQAPINGIVKTIPVVSVVALFQPAVYAL